jgi:hypothetical protein
MHYADVLDEINPRLPGLGLREHVLGFVPHRVEVGGFGTAGHRNDARPFLGECAYCQQHHNKRGSHDFPPTACRKSEHSALLEVYAASFLLDIALGESAAIRM